MTTDFDLITVTPWRSSGRHRLYASDRRQSLRFLDETTGTVVLTDDRHQPVVEQALRTAGYPPARRTGEESKPARPTLPGPRRSSRHTATPARDGAPQRGGGPTRPSREERTVARYLKPTEPADGHDGDRTRPARADEPPRPAEPTDRPGDEHPAVTDALRTPTADPADPGPEQVWATLAAGRAPRTTAAPRGRRDPSTTLTALLLGEPSPSIARHVKVDAEISALVDADPSWHVLEVDGAEIEHLLVGPGGAFTLSTKTCPGATVQITCQSAVVDGSTRPWVPIGLRTSRRASRTLSQACHQTVTVTAVLVIDADTLTTTLPPPVGVVALDHRDLSQWLRAQPEVLTPGTIAMLADTARQSTSWYRR